MARKAQENAAQDSGDFSFDNITVTDSEYVPARAARNVKPNPLLGAMETSLREGAWKQLPPIPADRAKDADNYLRRAAVKLGCGVDIRISDVREDGTVVVHFHANPEKRKRAYTVDDVRSWAREQGFGESDLLPKVHRDISNAYREAHGMKVVKTDK